jgi:hypothetical protein
MTDDDRQAVEPFGGAGLFDVDPEQDGVNQDPGQDVSGELDALPEEQGL